MTTELPDTIQVTDSLDSFKLDWFEKLPGEKPADRWKARRMNKLRRKANV